MLDESSRTAVEQCARVIGEREREIGAWVQLDLNAAMVRADELDTIDGSGALHGVPVGVKDVIDSVDFPTEYGSPIYRHHQPQADAAVITQLKAAGAIILGKTSTTEFATLQPTGTRNPLDLGRTPGGSSSGSAAAVAAGMVPVAIGTQTVGSTIRPASFCGVLGYKPSFGSISFSGVKRLAPSQDTIGLFAVEVEMLERLACGLGFATGARQDEIWLGRRAPRIGVLRGIAWDIVGQEARDAVLAAARRAAAAGATISVPPIPDVAASMIEDQINISERETSISLGGVAGRYGDQISELLADLIARGRRVSNRAYLTSLRRRTAAAGALIATMREVDVLMVPAATSEAPVGTGSTGDPTASRPWSLLGWPAVSVPGMVGPTGMPIGVQFVAPYGRDGRLLAAVRWMERVLDDD